MIVVFPHPLAPTMMVRGKQKAITCSSSLGEKDRMPRMESLEIDAMISTSCSFYVGLILANDDFFFWSDLIESIWEFPS